jgi:hypothetical protein
MAADDDTAGKIGIGFRWHWVADANLTIGWHRLSIGLQIG